MELRLSILFVLLCVGGCATQPVAPKSEQAPKPTTEEPSTTVEEPMETAPEVALADRCQENLKIMADALLLFVDNNDGRFPEEDWQNALLPYFGEMDVLNCPALRERGQYGGYAFNSDLYGKALSDFALGEPQAVIYESGVVGDNIAGKPVDDSEARHGGRAFAVYTDGSVMELER